MSLRAENKQRRRLRILDAARAIVAKRGVDALSMRMVARDAGLSVTTLYNLFGSKEEIRAALCGDLLDGIDREIAKVPLSRPIERAEAVITVGAAHVASAGEVARTALLASRAGAGHAGQDISRPRSVEMQRVAIQAAMDAGLLRAELAAGLVAAQVYEGFSVAALRWANRELDATGFRDQALYSLYLCLLALASDEIRPALLRSIQSLESRMTRRAKRAA